MKKNFLRSLLLAGMLTVSAVLAGSTAVPVLANHYPETDPGWTVTFDSSSKMVSNFEKNVIDQTVAAMQPGDDATFRVTIRNTNKQNTNWYMENAVLKSLEDRSALAATTGAGYGYKLDYINSSGVREPLFDSDKVGGDQGYVDRQNRYREGLNEATENLEDWFFLEELGSGRSGHVELLVTLEGETQGNAYQDTLADLQMNFAVELLPGSTTPPGSTTRTNVVKTGDNSHTMLYLVMAGVAGVVLLVLAIAGMKLRKREAMEYKGADADLQSRAGKGGRR